LEMIEDFKKKYANILQYADVIIGQGGLELLNNPRHDPESDEFLKLFISQGPGAILIKRSETDGFYHIDVNDMSQFEVRKGFIKYGGKITFDSQFNIDSIEYDGKIYHPGDNHWHHVKYILRSSIIVSNTIKHHAGYLHLFCGSRVPYALDKLPDNHYLNIFMNPFTYNNIPAANLAKTVLYGNRRYFHRLFAFTKKGLDDYNKYIFDSYQYVSFREQYNTLGDIVDSSPFYIDGIDLWNVIHYYIESYLRAHYDKNDKYIQKMLDALSKSTNNKIVIDNNLPDLAYFFTQYIFQCTSIHEILGNHILRYTYDPRIMSTKLRWNEDYTEMYPDVQTYYQTMVIAIATSIAKLPRLMDNFSFIFDNDTDKQLFYQFNSDLKDLVKTINNRNLDRIEVYNGANPDYLEVSMSV
jgi:hypothetical protein